MKRFFAVTVLSCGAAVGQAPVARVAPAAPAVPAVAPAPAMAPAAVAELAAVAEAMAGPRPVMAPVLAQPGSPVEPAELMEMALAMAQQPPAPPAPAAAAPGAPPAPPRAPEPPRARAYYAGDSYRIGTRALNDRRYEDAVRAFDAVITGKQQTRVDGAIYWKAYALHKMGRRADALAALQQLEQEHGSSAWINDAKALRMEVQQSSGQAVSPESQSDEDLKLLAINGLMHSDPERAFPLLDKVLADPKASPKVKERALFVMAQSKDAKARESLLRIAKGGGNPDLQVKAIEFIGISGHRGELGQMYSTTAAPQVKEAIITGLFMARDVDKLMDIARTEKDSKYRASAIEKLGVMRSDRTSEALASLYGAESDQKVKRTILDAMFMQRNAKALITLARNEKDSGMKRVIVERLSVMKDKEAAEYMAELLK